MNRVFKKFNKTEARKRYHAGEEIIIVGDNVNQFHILDGWALGLRISNQDDKESRDMGLDMPTFDQRVDNFEDYMERELGRRCAYYQEVTK